MKVLAVSISERKGIKKHPVEYIELIEGYGIDGDAHAGKWHRQVSLLAVESMEAMKEKLPTLSAGDFAENILTEGIVLYKLPIGTILKVGECTLEVTQIGKECHLLSYSKPYQPASKWIYCRFRFTAKSTKAFPPSVVKVCLLYTSGQGKTRGRQSRECPHHRTGNHRPRCTGH